MKLMYLSKLADIVVGIDEGKNITDIATDAGYAAGKTWFGAGIGVSGAA